MYKSNRLTRVRLINLIEVAWISKISGKRHVGKTSCHKNNTKKIARTKSKMLRTTHSKLKLLQLLDIQGSEQPEHALTAPESDWTNRTTLF